MDKKAPKQELAIMIKEILAVLSKHQEEALTEIVTSMKYQEQSKPALATAIAAHLVALFQGALVANESFNVPTDLLSEALDKMEESLYSVQKRDF